jgi:hypothetical protein
MTQWQRFSLFVKEGVFHILNGIDHLLFVLMLLLSSIVRYSHSQGAKKQTFIALVQIITTFSFAHSITLFIAGMGWYVPNTMIIESGIAFSIFIVATCNFLKKYEDVSYLIVFLFGLIHGFGFANVLEIAHVRDATSFVVALFGFNAGVELGQLGVIVLVLPILFFLVRLPYHKQIIRFIAFITMVISLIWFFQRVGLV